MAEPSLTTAVTEVSDNYFETSPKDFFLRSKFIGVTTTERWTLSPYLVIAAAAALFLNGSILVTILRHQVLRQKALFLILGWQVFCDFATPFIYVPIALLCLWSEDVDLPEALGVLQAGLRLGVSTLMSIHVLTLLGFERYVFICQPLRYNACFSMKKTIGYLSGILALVTVWMAINILNSDLHEPVWQLTYSLALSWERKDMTVIGALIYAAAPLLTQAYCFWSVTGVVLRQRRRIAAMSGQGAEAEAHLSTTPGILRAVIGVARLCGIYWITWFPPALVIMVMHFEYRGAIPSPGFQHTLRLTILFVMTVPPICNPLVCLRSMADLRGKWLKMFGIDSKMATDTVLSQTNA